MDVVALGPGGGEETIKTWCRKMAPPLVTLLASEPEVGGAAEGSGGCAWLCHALRQWPWSCRNAGAADYTNLDKGMHAMPLRAQ